MSFKIKFKDGSEKEFESLSGANLRRAYLSNTYLNHCKGITTFQLSKHLAVIFKNNNKTYAKIGCKCFELGEWCDRFEEIGKEAKYSESEIKHYGAFLKYFNNVGINID